MVNKENLQKILKELEPYHATLTAVSKTKPVEMIQQVYDCGHKIFGENYVQETAKKYELLPKDIEWHFIGHLQRNKIKYIAPFVKLIQSIDNLNLLKEINKQAKKNERVIDCLLQVHIAEEETKFGLSFEECENILRSEELKTFENIRINGLMGMATLTEDKNQIRKEFKSLNLFFRKLQTSNPKLKTLSMGMTSDYKIALEEGSNMVRIGSAIFGKR